MNMGQNSVNFPQTGESHYKQFVDNMSESQMVDIMSDITFSSNLIRSKKISK